MHLKMSIDYQPCKLCSRLNKYMGIDKPITDASLIYPVQSILTGEHVFQRNATDYTVSNLD